MGVSICTYGLPARQVRELVVAAEAAGFDAVWVGEHMVVPGAVRSQHPTQPGAETAVHNGRAIVDPATVLADPLVALATGAGATTTVGLATAIYVLPLRHPLDAARATATLQEASGGRLVLGVGLGWLEEEFAALGIDHATRRRRYEEALEVLRMAWAGGMVSYAGEHFAFTDVQVTPHPVQIPLVLGGNTAPAVARAARLGDGWITSGTPTFEAAVDLHATVRAAVDAAGRAAGFRTWVRMASVDPADVARYRAEGLDDLVVWAHRIFGELPLDATAERHDAVLRVGRELGLTPAGPSAS